MGKRILCLYRPQENKRKFTPFFTKKYYMSNGIALLGNACSDLG